jgi:signal transduction histidine kinase
VSTASVTAPRQHWFGPWPLRPGWMIFLIFVAQNFGIGDARLVRLDDVVPSNIDPELIRLAIVRALTSLALALVVVAAEWLVWRLTTLRGRSQPLWAYAAMVVVGAASASTFRAVSQMMDGLSTPIPSPGATFMHYLALLVALHVAIGIIGSRVTQSSERAEEALAKLNEQERRFVASEERARRIAAEFLHDRVQADLLVIAMELKRVGEDAPDDVAQRIASITETVESVRLTDVRDTSRSLSPLVQATGLASALTILADRWAPAMRVALDISPSVGALDEGNLADPDRALGIYRIVEQALLNAAAHGQARQSQVSITEQDRAGIPWVRVHVTDDGVGFDPAAAETGGGFATSQVWARLLDGEWSVESAPGRGATVTAWVPTSPVSA